MCIRASKLAAKYDAVLDRESAYEILSQKIARAEQDAREEAPKTARNTTGRTTSRRRSQAQDPVIKVLTSATFIRGVLGILKKAMK